MRIDDSQSSIELAQLLCLLCTYSPALRTDGDPKTHLNHRWARDSESIMYLSDRKSSCATVRWSAVSLPLPEKNKTPPCHRICELQVWNMQEKTLLDRGGEGCTIA